MAKCPNCKTENPKPHQNMEIWHIHGKSLHLQKLPNTIQRILWQKWETQLYIKTHER